jgi:hypothetical protein
MFYAGIEGRKFGLAKAVEDGLQGAIYNIVYPPGEDEASIEDFQFMVNTQSFRLPYEENTWSPKLADHLSKFGPIGPDELVEADADGVPQKLAPAGETLCDDLIELQDDYNATMLLAPYFFAASVDDAALEASLLCSQYVAEHWEGDVLAGVMLDASHLTNNAAFERLSPPRYAELMASRTWYSHGQSRYEVSCRHCPPLPNAASWTVANFTGNPITQSAALKPGSTTW